MNKNHGLINRVVFGVTLACPGCAQQAPSFCLDRSTAESTSLQAEIASMLNRQAAAWNRGDLEAFMAYYLRSDRLTFSSGGHVARGWDRTIARYRERYPSRSVMGTLTFDDLEIRELSPGAALVLGSWHLDRDEPTGGAFTLVLQKRGGRWLIVHDHTSVIAP